MPKTKDAMNLPKRKFKIMNLVWTIIMVAGLFISIDVTNTHISVLFQNWDQFADIFVQMSHPDWGYMSVIWPKLIETIKMAVLGTVIGSVIAFYLFIINRT